MIGYGWLVGQSGIVALFVFGWTYSSRLLPLGADADDTADGTGNADEAIVELGEAEGSKGDGEVAAVGEELEAAGGALEGDALALDDALAVLAINVGLALLEPVEGVDLGDDAEGEAHGPEAVGLALGVLCTGPLADAGGVEDGGGVEGEVAGVAELAADGGIPEDRVRAGGLIGGEGGGLEVLDVLAEAHDLAGEAELLLEGVPGQDGGGEGVGAEEVPGVEAGKVLDGAEELVAADGGGDELEVVGHRGVVDDCVGDHCEDVVMSLVM
jgi:hypothetical protein